MRPAALPSRPVHHEATCRSSHFAPLGTLGRSSRQEQAPIKRMGVQICRETIAFGPCRNCQAQFQHRPTTALLQRTKEGLKKKASPFAANSRSGHRPQNVRPGPATLPWTTITQQPTSRVPTLFNPLYTCPYLSDTHAQLACPLVPQLKQSWPG